MKKAVLIILLCMFNGVATQYAQSVNALIEKGKEILYNGRVHFDQSEMFEARGMFERALAIDEANYLAQYYLSLTDYNLAVYSMRKNEKEQFQKFAFSSEEILKKLIHENELDAEAVSLLGALYGIQVAMNPDLGASLGSQNIALTSRAFGTAPDNPRVLLQKGVSKFNSPEFVGGSKTEALKYFSQSVKAFESQAEKNKEIDWGYLDALAWLGVAYFNSDDYEKAIITYKKALEVEPDFARVKYDLLPKAEEKLTSTN
ncbi:MAG: tetratricopeptide repeat protein [Ignavibacteria bacterium]|nr:tetratricopeptide repeat protein [Ignavibacteria bacterium]